MFHCGKKLFILSIVITLTLCSPMVYKKNEHDKYEPELVAVSSTVIPLSVYEVSYGIGGKPSEEYKRSYIKNLYKKVNKSELEDPDTLITLKKKYHHKKDQDDKVASVKSI